MHYCIFVFPDSVCIIAFYFFTGINFSRRKISFLCFHRFFYKVNEVFKTQIIIRIHLQILLDKKNDRRSLRSGHQTKDIENRRYKK